MNIICLKSSDEEIFEMDINAAKMSGTLRTMLAELGSDDDGEIIDLPKVNSRIMKLVIDWTTYRLEHPIAYELDDDDSDDESHAHRSDDIDEWDAEFLKPLDTGTLFELLMATNYLYIKGLMNATAKTIANMIKGKTPEQIREVFNITPLHEQLTSEDDVIR